MERVKIEEREEEIEGRESRLPIGLREPADKVEVNSVQQGLVAAEQHVDQSSNVGDGHVGVTVDIGLGGSLITTQQKVD